MPRDSTASVRNPARCNATAISLKSLAGRAQLASRSAIPPSTRLTQRTLAPTILGALGRGSRHKRERRPAPSDRVQSAADTTSGIPAAAERTDPSGDTQLPMPQSYTAQAFALLPLAALLGCAPTLMPTPNLYGAGHRPLFRELAPELETPSIDVLYVTDRAPIRDAAGGLRYGDGRSPSAAYGSAQVEIGDDLSWEELLVHSTQGSPPLRRPRLRVESIGELGRFPETPYRFRVSAPGEVEVSPETRAERIASLGAARSELSARLALTERKEVYLFIHGVNTSFETAAMWAAENWHYLGREGVAIAYTWPTSDGGPLGYAYDRESGEFTIFHLKQLFNVLAATPNVEKVHVIAHSRGTDVATTALRELIIQTRAAGADPHKRLKVGNLVLLAADLDFEVVMQRLVAEALGSAVERVTLYGYSHDDALKAANSLLRSQMRMGELSTASLSEQQRSAVDQATNVDIVSYDGRVGGAYGHFYFRESPAMSSDIFALLRYGDPPGRGTREGLHQSEPGSNFWTVRDDNLESRGDAVSGAPGS